MGARIVPLNCKKRVNSYLLTKKKFLLPFRYFSRIIFLPFNVYYSTGEKIVEKGKDTGGKFGVPPLGGRFWISTLPPKGGTPNFFSSHFSVLYPARPARVIRTLPLTPETLMGAPPEPILARKLWRSILP